MKRLQQSILILVLLVGAAVSAAAATINIAAHTVNTTTTFTGSTCSLRIYSSISFTAADGTTVMAGAPGTGAFFKSVACTISSGVVTIPSFSLPSTTDALDNQTARYTALFYDSKSVRQDMFLADFALPTSLGTSVTWGQIKVYKAGKEPWRDTSTYQKSQTDAQIAQAVGLLDDANDVRKGRSYLNVAPQSSVSPVAIGSNWGRLNALALDVSEYGNSLNSAATAIGSIDKVTLAVSRATTVTANLTITPNIELIFKNGGYLDAGAGTWTVGIQGPFTAPPSKIFYNFAAGQGTISFAGNKTIDALRPEWWGAAGGVESTAAIQAAINAVGNTTTLRPGIVQLLSTYIISSTLLIDKKSVVLKGMGWGDATAGQGAALVWNGAAGIPMIKITRSYGAGVSDLRIIGKDSAKPSAAINFFEDAVTVNIQPFVQNVWIGSNGYDTTGGAGTKASGQFTNGILLDGTNTNNSEGKFDFIHIFGSGVGINVSNTQYGDHVWSNLYVEQCTTGFTTAAAGQSGINWFFGNNDVDMKLTQNGAQTHVMQYTSEGAGRMLQLVNAAITSFYCVGCQFQAGANLNADGFFIDAGQSATSNSQVAITLDNFVLQQVSPPVTPKIRVRGNSNQVLLLRNVRGITSANLDVTPDSGNDPDAVRLVQIEGVETAGLTTPLYGRNILTYPDTVDLTRWDTQADLKVKGVLLAKTIDRVCYATNQTGADIGAKVNACDALLGATKGEILLTEGGNIATQIIVSAHHTLRVLSGTYTSTVNGAVILLKDNTTVDCASWGPILQESTGSEGGLNSPFIIIGDHSGHTATGGLNQNITIRGCHLKGARSNFNSVPQTIGLGNCQNCIVEGNWLDATRTIGIQAGGSSATGNFSKNTQIRNNLLTAVASQAIAVTNGERITIAGNQIIAPGQTGGPGNTPIDIEPNASTDRIRSITIENNLIDAGDSPVSVTINAILVQNGAGTSSYGPVLIQGNSIIGGPLSGAGNRIAHGHIYVLAPNTHVIGNYLQRGYNCLNAEFATGGSFIGNTLNGCGYTANYSILLDNASGFTVTDNVILIDPADALAGGQDRTIMEMNASTGNRYSNNTADIVTLLGTSKNAHYTTSAGVFTVPGGIQHLSGTRPTCNSTNRGYTWYVAGGAGVLDTFEVCRKDSSDVYAWITLF